MAAGGARQLASAYFTRAATLQQGVPASLRTELLAQAEQQLARTDGAAAPSPRAAMLGRAEQLLAQAASYLPRLRSWLPKPQLQALELYQQRFEETCARVRRGESQVGVLCASWCCMKAGRRPGCSRSADVLRGWSPSHRTGIPLLPAGLPAHQEQLPYQELLAAAQRCARCGIQVWGSCNLSPAAGCGSSC